MKKNLVGLMAGCLGTVVMTAAMAVMHRWLPKPLRYPLPPRQVTMAAAHKIGIGPYLDEETRVMLTTTLHFAYGSAVGALYRPSDSPSVFAPLWRGTAFGLAVWTVSYLGWVPAMGLLPPATEHAPRRTTLMIVAHVIWGTVIASIRKVISRQAQ